MQAGKLRHRVKIQKKTVTRDSRGGEIITWTDVISVWASVDPLSGREYLELARDNAENMVRITIRYQDGILPEYTILFGGQRYEIQSIINTKSIGRELVFMCRLDVDGRQNG